MVADTSHTVARSEPTTTSAWQPAVVTWLWCVAGLVFAMIIVGGATRLTDSGLSITEWKPILGAIPPLSEADWLAAFEKYKQIPEYEQINSGMSLAAFKFIFWWEWAHRFLGRFIGLAYALPLAVFWFAGALPQGFKLRLLGVLLLGGLQGVIGWYMVMSGLVDRVDVSQYRLAMHLGLAFIIFACLVWLALDIKSLHRQEKDAQATSSWLRLSGYALVVLIVLQVLLGAFVAGTKAGLTYNTWPLMNGDFVPRGLWQLSPWYLNVFENISAIQFNHRIVAYVVLAFALVHALWATVKVTGAPLVKATAWVVLVAIFAQAVVGIATLVLAEGAIPIGLGLVHQGGAAVVLGFVIWHLHTLHRSARM